MIRIGEFMSVGLRSAAIIAFALLLMTPRPAAAQDPAPAAADALKFSANTPVYLLIQINPEKASDFESVWSGLKAGFAKSTDDGKKSFGESLSKLFKVDQPAMPGAGGKPMMLYILQLDSPSTTISYDPYKMIWEQLWDKDDAKTLLTRAEADAIFEKLKGALMSVNLWKLIKVGS
jgi:hypothetical protein